MEPLVSQELYILKDANLMQALADLNVKFSNPNKVKFANNQIVYCLLITFRWCCTQRASENVFVQENNKQMLDDFFFQLSW